jgi:transketolase
MEKESTRKGFGKALAELGRENKRIVALSADLTESTCCSEFKQKFPKRFLEMGVAEQNSVGVAVGLSFTDYIPFVTSFAVFMPNRCLDHIRVSVCYGNANVKIIGSHAGVITGEDGATHQALEDIAIMRSLPNMAVIVPCDFVEAQKATKAMAKYKGPCYLRLMREKTQIITKAKDAFRIGKANVLKMGKDATIIACGEMVAEALAAAEMLENEKIKVSVVNMHTIKPLDVDVIMSFARKTGAIVTAEDHQINGGLGSAVSEAVTSEYPVVVRKIAIQDRFGQSGNSEELMEEYGLAAKDIVREVKKAVLMKKKK